MKPFMKILVAVVVLGIAQNAWARRDRRDGFNFGTTVKLVDTDDRRFAVGESTRDSRSKRAVQSFTPYMGYAFDGMFNLGIAATLQQSSERVTDKAKDGSDEILRSIDSSLKAGNLFVRLLFGRVMFLEAGTGLYSESIKVENEYKTLLGDGSYEGRREQFNASAMGLGYHGAIGVEIEMGNGFYFSSSFITRVYNLKESKNKDLGSKTGYQQNRELNFGIAYYYN